MLTEHIYHKVHTPSEARQESGRDQGTLIRRKSRNDAPHGVENPTNQPNRSSSIDFCEWGKKHRSEPKGKHEDGKSQLSTGFRYMEIVTECGQRRSDHAARHHCDKSSTRHHDGHNPSKQCRPIMRVCRIIGTIPRNLSRRKMGEHESTSALRPQAYEVWLTGFAGISMFSG